MPLELFLRVRRRRAARRSSPQPVPVAGPEPWGTVPMPSCRKSLESMLALSVRHTISTENARVAGLLALPLSSLCRRRLQEVIASPKKHCSKLVTNPASIAGTENSGMDGELPC